MKLKRNLLLFTALALALAAHADLASLFTNAAAVKRAPGRLPSIIFIQCHGLAPGDLSCYGQTNFQTPNLDRLAATGIRFTHYTGGDDSAATTAMLLTGKISVASGGEPNLAQRLQQNGYHTGLIGEWSLAGKPWEQGFDEFAGFLEDADARDYYADGLWRYAPDSFMDPTNNRLTTYVGREMIYANCNGKKGKYLPELFVTAMDNFVRVNTPDLANHYRPFFLLVNFPAPRTARAGADDFPVPSDAPFTGEAWPAAAKNRAALVTRLDAGIGRLFEQLGKSKLTNNVAILFTASSAPEKFVNPRLNFLLPPDSFRTTNNPAPRLPLLVNWPGKFPAGRIADGVWTAADFAPTALELAEVNSATNGAGHSLLPVLLGKKAEAKNP